MKRLIAISLIVLTGLFMFGCTSKSAESNAAKAVHSEEYVNNSASAEQVIKDHFKFWNEQNVDNLLKTMVSNKEGENRRWGFDNLEYIKILSITEDTSKQSMDGFMYHGAGTGKTFYAVKIFMVKYEVKYKNDAVEPMDSGVTEWYYFVTKDTKDSPWLIADWGY